MSSPGLRRIAIVGTAVVGTAVVGTAVVGTAVVGTTVVGIAVVGTATASRVSVMVRASIRTSWVVNFAPFRCYRPVIYTCPTVYINNSLRQNKFYLKK